MSDPRDHPLFWETRTLLEGTIGPKIRLTELTTLMQQIARDHQLHIPRMAVRRKNNAIQWMCENIKHAESVLSPVAQPANDRASVEARVKRNWAMIPTVRRWLRAQSDRRPRMPDMIATATHFAETLKIRIDRQARRNRDALECWFAENWSAVSSVDTPNPTWGTNNEFPDFGQFEDDFGLTRDKFLDDF
jgi:hypothetical protein